MIIECINCSKKFDVNSDLIPLKGRTIQCGSCGYTWFFKKNTQEEKKSGIDNFQKKIDIIPKKSITRKKPKTISKKERKIQENIKKKGTEIIEYESKPNFSFGKFLSYLIVIIVSFISIILILDTFKLPLYRIFPDLEILLFNFYETLKDIQLFIKDLFYL